MTTPSERQQITAPEFKDNFVMIPNMIDDSDLDPYEYRLLVHYYRVGTCWKSTTTTAEDCKMSRPQVVAKRQSLAEKGWIRIKRGGAQDSLIITVVDKWVENHQKYVGAKEEVPPPVGDDQEAGQEIDWQEVTELTGGGQDVDSKNITIKNNPLKNIKDSGKSAAPPEPQYIPAGQEFEDPKPKTAKQQRKERDALLDHPAILAYRSIAHLNVDFTWRPKVADGVGTDPEKIARWETLITDWIGNGWKKTNVKGMLDAFKNGGIQDRRNGNKQSNEERLKNL